MENELVKKWEISGFLENKTDKEKIILSSNLEKARILLYDSNYLNKFKEMVFPLIVRLTKKQNIFNIEIAITKFHTNFIINGYDLDTIDEEIKYLTDFVSEYQF